MMMHLHKNYEFQVIFKTNSFILRSNFNFKAKSQQLVTITLLSFKTLINLIKSVCVTNV